MVDINSLNEEYNSDFYGRIHRFHQEVLCVVERTHPMLRTYAVHNNIDAISEILRPFCVGEYELFDTGPCAKEYMRSLAISYAQLYLEKTYLPEAVPNYINLGTNNIPSFIILLKSLRGTCSRPNHQEDIIRSCVQVQELLSAGCFEIVLLYDVMLSPFMIIEPAQKNEYCDYFVSAMRGEYTDESRAFIESARKVMLKRLHHYYETVFKAYDTPDTTKWPSAAQLFTNIATDTVTSKEWAELQEAGLVTDDVATSLKNIRDHVSVEVMTKYINEQASNHLSMYTQLHLVKYGASTEDERKRAMQLIVNNPAPTGTPTGVLADCFIADIVLMFAHAHGYKINFIEEHKYRRSK